MHIFVFLIVRFSVFHPMMEYMWLFFHYYNTNFIGEKWSQKYITGINGTKRDNACVWDTEAGHCSPLKASGNRVKISVQTGSLCKSNNKLVLMINRLSYQYTRARGQHALWHPSSLSNAARKWHCAWWEKNRHTKLLVIEFNTHNHAVPKSSVAFSPSGKHSETRSHTRSHSHKSLNV